MATIGSAKATLVNKIDSLTSSATAKDTIFLAKALKENSSLNNFVWQGNWAATTEYSIDDVVASGGNTYICKVAHTSGASFALGNDWDMMVSAGTNGTDGTTVGTGTAGQVLKTNAAGNAIEWADGLPSGGTIGQVVTNTGSGTGSWQDAAAGGKVLKVVNKIIGSNKSRLNTSSTSWTERNGFSTTITPTSTSSGVLINVSFGWSNNASSDRWFATLYRNGVNVVDDYGLAVKQNTVSGKVNETVNISYLDSPNTTSACTYTLHFRSYGGTGWMESPGEVSSASESIILMEIGA